MTHSCKTKSKFDVYDNSYFDIYYSGNIKVVLHKE